MIKKIIKHRKSRLKNRFASKKSQVIRIKQSCADDDFNGVFTSDHLINKSGFVDFCFIGKYRGHEVVFNACITTADSDYYEALESNAFDDIPYPDEIPMIFSNKRTTEQEEVISNHYREHSEYIMRKLANREVTIPAWKVTLEHHYKFGIGLHIRINKPYIEIEDINQFIADFKKKSIRVFEDKESEFINKNAEELGVKLADGDIFIRWERGSPDIAQLNI